MSVLTHCETFPTTARSAFVCLELVFPACFDCIRARFKYVLPFYFVLGMDEALLGVALRCVISTATRFYWHNGPVKWHSAPVYGTATRFYPQAYWNSGPVLI